MRQVDQETACSILRNPAILEQSVEISTQDGLTLTTRTPSNQQLLESAQTMEPAPQFVFRRINFPNGVPEEYAWTTAFTSDAASLRDIAGSTTQRLSLDTWLDLIEAEAQHPGGHIGPAHEERAGSRCPACRLTRERLLAQTQPEA